jgi:hypothetical protein
VIPVLAPKTPLKRLPEPMHRAVPREQYRDHYASFTRQDAHPA